MNRAVILTAIRAEYMAVRNHLSALKEETHPQGTIYERGQFSANGRSWQVGIVEIGAGNTRAAMEAERAIAYFNPGVVLFVGVAGGIKDVKLGDVVAATKVYGYESGKTEVEFKPRPDVGESSYKLIQRAKAEARKPDWLKKLTSGALPNVFLAPIAAGEKVVASKKSSTFDFLQNNYGDALAVEMEGRGLLQATHANQQVSALIIRGISDLIDSKSEADATGSQEIAARHASAFAFQILAKLETIPVGGLNPPSNNINPATPYSVESFESSWNNLPPEAQQLGCRLSLFAPSAFEWSLVESCVIETEDEEEWHQQQEVLEELRVRFLVNRNLLQLTEQKTYQLHQRIRKFFQTKLDQLPEADCYKQRFCQAMVAVAKKIPETPTRDQIAAVTPAIPHLAEAATVLTDWLRDEDLIWPFVGLGRFSYGQGTYDQSESWYEKCLEITRSRLGENHPDVAESLNNLANLYNSMGHYEQAKPLLVQALEMRKNLLGENHPDVARSLRELAAVYWSMGHYDQAEPLFQQALEMRKQLLGENHPDVAKSLKDLGFLYNSMGRYDQAEPLIQQALEMRKQLLGHDHPDVATSLHNLAFLYESMGRYDEAEPLIQQALEMRKQLLGHHHPDVAESLNNLALLYHYLRRYDQSEPLFKQALEIRKQLLGQNHPDVATSLSNLAFLYWSQGRYNQAETLFVQALEIAEGRLGSNHPKTVTIRKSLKILRSPVLREITRMGFQLSVGLKSWFPH